MNRKYLLLDYGGVFGDHHLEAAEVELSGHLGVDRKTLRRFLSENSLLGDLVRRSIITNEEYWSGLWQLLGMDVAEMPPADELLRLWAATYTPNMEVLEQLRASDPAIMIGLLTNTDSGRLIHLKRQREVMAVVDFIVPSCYLGVTKGSVEYWESTDVMLGCPRRADAIYVDDRTHHIKMAERVGWQGQLYSEPSHVVEAIEKLTLE